jgi:hypothetical protein
MKSPSIKASHKSERYVTPNFLLRLLKVSSMVRGDKVNALAVCFAVFPYNRKKADKSVVSE